MTKSKNPYRVPANQTKQVRLTKGFVKLMEKEQAKQQRIADSKLGKGKYKVSLTFVSKVWEGLLR